MFWNLLTAIPGLANGLLTYLNKKQDNALEEFRVGNTNGKDVSIAVVLAEQARINALKDLSVNAMSHPVWWFAWGLGVFPVLGYYAAIFWVSTFPGLGWTVLKVPPDVIDYGRLVVGSMFGIAGASSIVTGVAHAWAKRT